MLSRIAPILALLFASGAVLAAEGLSQVVPYTSSLDNSTQQYAVYLPQRPAPSPAGYPAIFHAHGYGWSVSAGFSDFQKQWAERQGWILINLNARGPQFYEGVGDVETHNVIRDANHRFGLDLSRLFITGGSMGGTGAYRLGIRYPDVFAATVGVDGWSDFREWHRHWYARTDMPNDIEEFRRPLLEACSPLYWTGRSRWGQVQASVSGKDSVVLPENGLSLYNALLERTNNMPGAYESRLFLDEAAGHCGSTRMDQIYAFFANRAAQSDPGSFLCESTILTHGDFYWGSMERLTVQGAFASLESDTVGNVVTVLTRNVSQFAIHLQVSPVATRPKVTVYADGFPCYQGPPKTVHLQADFSPTGQLWGWREVEPSGLRKTPAFEGPLGEAFKVPFVVVYGTAGSAADTARNLREASDFAHGWNGFMVHAETLLPVPEDRLDGPSLQSRSLIMFGTETSSRLLQRAAASYDLPVHVLSNRIVVDDPQWG
ncbi:MAG: prolyl oligopeptidase family serine peptidase, partial [Armatimonadota bacterium]